jgi:hypothetical protein
MHFLRWPLLVLLMTTPSSSRFLPFRYAFHVAPDSKLHLGSQLSPMKKRRLHSGSGTQQGRSLEQDDTLATNESLLSLSPPSRVSPPRVSLSPICIGGGAIFGFGFGSHLFICLGCIPFLHATQHRHACGDLFSFRQSTRTVLQEEWQGMAPDRPVQCFTFCVCLWSARILPNA